jgi:hypothetical protein
MPRPPRLSIDQGIKELLQLRPRDAFEFLLPDLHVQRGDPASWEFLSTQVRKKDLLGKGFTMDLSIRYEFVSGHPVLLVLVEHWSNARNMDLVRTAHYYLDLLGRFPGDEIVPVALITEPTAHSIASSLVGSASGETFLKFKTRVVQLAAEDCQRWAEARNLVAATQLVAMGGVADRARKLLMALEAFRREASDEEVQLLFPLMVELGRFTEEEEETAMSYLATAPKPRLLVKWEKRVIEQGLAKGLEQGLQQGLQQGLRQKALEDARRMLAHGIAWEIITDVTGIGPEDL